MDENQTTELRRVFELQSRNRWNTKVSTAEQRRERLTRLRAAIVAHADEVAAALHSDLRRPVGTGMPSEMYPVLTELDEAIAKLDDWMAPSPVEASGALSGAELFVQYEARGVVLLFGAWNFPFTLLFQPLVPIIAAGNTAIVKANELAPATAALSAKIIRETFDEREVAIFEGGVDLAEALLELPVDHIFFTGSPAVARTVMSAAAKHLASVTLELGGKCPAIIDGTTSIDAAVDLLGRGKMMNSGQICLSPDHVWIKEELRDQFVDAYTAWIDEHYYTDGTFQTDSFSRIVNERNFERVGAYLDDAAARGAKVVGTGRRDADTLTVEPAVLLDVPLDAKVMQEEIFGPILPVLTYGELDEALEHIRGMGKPLAIYAFTDDEATTDALLAGTSSGGVTVNGWATHSGGSRLPFGGVGSSGQGAYHGIFGFRELSHARGVVIHPAG